MLDHILIPLDGSALAEAAIEEAQRVVSPTTLITLLMVVPKPGTAVYDYELTRALAHSYESTLAEILTQAKNYLQRVATELQMTGFDVRTIAEFGDDPADVINNAARESEVDAIVMCTHGRSGISRWVFGSVTGNVLSTASCPVLVVPSRERERAFSEAASEINYG
jgi:nucleotide-binding universal stress UspA family protein